MRRAACALLLPDLVGGQEVEDGPVMPDLIAAFRLPGQHVGNQPPNLAGSVAQAPPRVLHPGHRDFQDGDVLESAAQQGIGQP
jgi:hypothetical protein